MYWNIMSLFADVRILFFNEVPTIREFWSFLCWRTSSKWTLNGGYESTYVKVFPLPPQVLGKLLNILPMLSVLLDFCGLNYIKMKFDLLQIHLYNSVQIGLSHLFNVMKIKVLFLLKITFDAPSGGKHRCWWGPCCHRPTVWLSAESVKHIRTRRIIWMLFFCLLFESICELIKTSVLPFWFPTIETNTLLYK